MDAATRTESGALRLRAGASRVAPRAPRPWRSHLALVVAVAIVALPLGIVANARGRELAASPSGAVEAAAGLAMRVDAKDLAPGRGSAGMLVDLPAPGEVPVFPVAQPMSWAESLGEYFAWELWVGGAPGRDGPESCLLLASDSGTRSQCVTRELAARGALFVSLPYALIPSGARPDEMTSDQSVGFWWAPDGIVTIVLGPTG